MYKYFKCLSIDSSGSSDIEIPVIIVSAVIVAVLVLIAVKLISKAGKIKNDKINQTLEEYDKEDDNQTKNN